ncbi:NAD(P)H-flavin reductase [Kangiella sediminilitoris]|uniref:Oxidoreductase FAD/NAD(P)-binding domain protein n=1 Tax=Kangiella sediminilitoris TaxID=1144748 RepID=A0A1B3BDT4_9GAMM|nr:NAD(P)H-flavin reductase [Kangiella sediminilitoris]AOE50989.1 Oxidoreductase FAD/NAD(P)-binding domain protein [Kangiella sediminilitoris]
MSEQVEAEFVECEVSLVRRAGRDVFWVELEPVNGELPPYKAGQYLMLQLEDGSLRPFSIASSPLQDVLELHIRRLPGHDEADKIISQLKHQNRVKVQLPFGNCVLTDSKRPAVFIAGGTGFAPFHSVIKTALWKNTNRDLILYWGAQTSADLYLHREPNEWSSKYDHFTYVPVLSGLDEEWQGRKGFVHHAFLLDHTDITNMDIYIGGSEPMVMSVYQDLLDRGVSKDSIHSDILDIKRDMGQLD